MWNLPSATGATAGPDRLTPSDAVAWRDLAVTVATAGAARVRARAGAADLRVDTKSSATDPVTEVDREVEAMVVDALLRARPDDGLLGEEGASRPGTSGVRWLIDPIDGTVNFLYGIPGCNVSVAAEHDGRIVAAAVVDPLHDDVFAAARGHGATRNGAPITASAATDPAHSLVGTGFGYDPDRRRRQAEVLTRVITQVRDVRRVGAAAVDLCWVGCGRLDGYWEKGLQAWDWAAGSLVAEEAGATVGTSGDTPLPDGLPDACIVAAAPGLYEPLRRIVTAAGAADA